MNRLAAIFFTLLLAVAPLGGNGLATACPPAETLSCCDSTCADCTCCVEESRSTGAPLDDTSLPPRPAESLTGVPVPATAWELPLPLAPESLSLVRTSSAATRLPLFLRHCALLI